MEEMNTKKTGCCQTRYFHEAHGSSKVICLNKSCENYLGYTPITRNGNNQLKIVASALMMFVSIFLFTNNNLHSSSGNYEGASVMIPELEYHAPLNLENLAEEILKNDIQFPDVVYAQIRIESGNLKSSLLEKTNNMLGMRFPFQRSTTAIGLYLPAKDTIVYGTQDELRKYGRLNNYAVYEKWEDAVADYKLWQAYCFNNQNSYLDFLGRVYAEDPHYVKKIKQMTNS